MQPSVYPFHDLEQAQALPVSSYFDLDIFKKEQALLFASAPQYIGHPSYVPEPGRYHCLPQEKDARVLLRQTNDDIVLLSNICKHRQAIMLNGSGDLALTNNIVCPLHHWSYDEHGVLLGAPGFQHKPCQTLQSFALDRWNGLLWVNATQLLKQIHSNELLNHLDFSDYVLGHVEQHHCAYNWKTFMEVYLEDYHVASSHPGLGKLVDCSKLQWTFGQQYSVQAVGIQKNLNLAGTSTYARWQNALSQQGLNSGYGAIWLSIYPNIMIEWYPHVLVVSTLHPIDPQNTLNSVAFFYKPEILDFEPELCAAQRAAYMETCIEDDDFALRMDAGRKALWQTGRNETGPYLSPLEDGMVHFHQWYNGHFQP